MKILMRTGHLRYICLRLIEVNNYKASKLISLSYKLCHLAYNLKFHNASQPVMAVSRYHGPERAHDELLMTLVEQAEATASR